MQRAWASGPTNEQRNGSSYEWLHQPTRPAEPSPPPAPPGPPAPPRRSRRVIGALLVVGRPRGRVPDRAARLGAFADDGSNKEAVVVAPLPVSKGGAGETRINQIYERVEDSVVSIMVDTGSGGATGSGFVVSGDGTIVTNDHVVENASRVQVVFDDNRQGIPADVVGTDPSSDLAVLHVDPEPHAAAQAADPGRLRQRPRR